MLSQFGFDHSGGFGDGDFPASFVGEATHGNAVDPAGGDGEKWRQTLLSDVDGEAVHGDPFSHADADRGELAVSHPHAC